MKPLNLHSKHVNLSNFFSLDVATLYFISFWLKTESWDTTFAANKLISYRKERYILFNQAGICCWWEELIYLALTDLDVIVLLVRMVLTLIGLQSSLVHLSQQRKHNLFWTIVCSEGIQLCEQTTKNFPLIVMKALVPPGGCNLWPETGRCSNWGSRSLQRLRREKEWYWEPATEKLE